MSSTRRTPRTVVAAATAVAACITVVALGTVAASAAGSAGSSRAPAATHGGSPGGHPMKPTIVLVHGAFADASGWSEEIRFLARHGYPVIAPSNPLRGVASDANSIDGVLATIPGPVILVGHSYGGAVIAAAARNAPNVKALVYVSAFIPEQGRPAAYYTTTFPGSLLSNATLLIRPTYNPTLGGDPSTTNDNDVYINPADFQTIFAGDQSPTTAAVMAAEQRPVSLAAYTEQTVPAAKLPSWDLVSLDDKAIPPAAQEYMAEQAGARITAIHSAHDSLISHPRDVDSLIIAAVEATT